jgi:hypothetical protein
MKLESAARDGGDKFNVCQQTICPEQQRNINPKAKKD